MIFMDGKIKISKTGKKYGLISLIFILIVVLNPKATLFAGILTLIIFLILKNDLKRTRLRRNREQRNSH